VSCDGGESWTQLHADPHLPEPSCMAPILRYSWPDQIGSRILFANPASKNSRTNGTIRISYDEGRTWPVSRVIEPDFFAYSSLARLKNGDVGLLYECGRPLRISFMNISLGDLEKKSNP
jgi:sialidase-1